jgi:hypothetical protein
MKDNIYGNGKIYKVVSDHTNLIYIGSTIQKYLCSRLSGHKNNYKAYLNKKYLNCSVFKLLELVDVKIELIEEYKCNSKEELHTKERYYIELNKDIVVNKNIPTRTDKEYRIDNKEKIEKYRLDNRDKISQYKKTKYDCICSSKSITINHKARHEKSKKHETYKLIQCL